MNREEFGMPPVTSRFSEATGLVVESISPTEVRGHAELDENHHTPWGVVHGGVYTSLVESTASIGASYAVKDRNQFAVGVHNATDFLRPTPQGARADRRHRAVPGAHAAAVGGRDQRFGHRKGSGPRAASHPECG